jgi:nitroreductase
MKMDLATVDHLLTTTRSVRKRLDLTRPVEPEVIERCIEIALQAPTGGNAQNWHFVVVTDAQKKTAIVDLYRKAFEAYANRPADQLPQYGEGDPRARQMPRIYDSAVYLIQHLHEVPVLVIACIEGRVEKEPQFAQASVYGSILPAAWSFALALRARGLGTVWTTIHLIHEKEAAKILGIPDNLTQAVLFPVAYFKGTDFKPARRLPARNFTHWNTWGQQR